MHQSQACVDPYKYTKAWSRWPSSLERWSIMSVLKCASSPRSNPSATYVKERLLPSTKNTVTELWVIEFVS